MEAERVLIAASLLASAVSAASPVAHAQDGRTRAYVVAVPMSEDLEAVAARVGAAARASLREIPNVDWQGPDQAFLGYSDYNMQTLTQARERLAGGRQAYLDLELTEAIDLLHGAVEAFDAAASALEDPQDLGDALLFLGASQQFEGQAREARRTFARLHVQMPQIAPDPNVFNPDVVEAYRRAAPRSARRRTGSVRIESEPPGAIAYVDYVARGRTPLTVDGLADGVHVVRVTRPGATPFVEQVEVRRGRGGQVNAFLEDNPSTPGLAEALSALPRASDEEVEPDGPIMQIAGALELTKIGVIRVSDAGGPDRVQLQLLVFDAMRGERVLNMHGPVPTAAGELEAAVRRLLAQGLEAALTRGGPVAVGDDGEIIPAATGGPGAGIRDGDDDAGLVGEWWFWAGIGGAVALGIVLTIALASSGGQDLGENQGGQIILEF
jgi:hypothetical protein